MWLADRVDLHAVSQRPPTYGCFIHYHSGMALPQWNGYLKCQQLTVYELVEFITVNLTGYS